MTTNTPHDDAIIPPPACIFWVPDDMSYAVARPPFATIALDIQGGKAKVAWARGDEHRVIDIAVQDDMRERMMPDQVLGALAQSASEHYWSTWSISIQNATTIAADEVARASSSQEELLSLGRKRFAALRAEFDPVQDRGLHPTWSVMTWLHQARIEVLSDEICSVNVKLSHGMPLAEVRAELAEIGRRHGVTAPRAVQLPGSLGIAIMAQITNTKSGRSAEVWVDEEGFLCSWDTEILRECPFDVVWPDGYALACALHEEHQTIALHKSRLVEATRLAETLKARPLRYVVCTFGSPSWRCAEAEAGVSSMGRGVYASPDEARRVADQCPGTGSCTNARVAVVYEDSAAPDISLGGGRGWEWASYRWSREDELAKLQADMRAAAE